MAKQRLRGKLVKIFKTEILQILHKELYSGTEQESVIRTLDYVCPSMLKPLKVLIVHTLIKC